MNRLNVLNVKNNSDIPSYSIEGRSEWDSLALTKEEYWLYHVLALAVAFDADSWYEVPASLAKYPFMFALGELSLTGNELLGVPNDRIVGGESQRGGIEEGSTQWFNVPFHNLELIFADSHARTSYTNLIVALLNCSLYNSDTFSEKGFHPRGIEFQLPLVCRFKQMQKSDITVELKSPVEGTIVEHGQQLVVEATSSEDVRLMMLFLVLIS